MALKDRNIFVQKISDIPLVQLLRYHARRPLWPYFLNLKYSNLASNAILKNTEFLKTRIYYIYLDIVSNAIMLVLGLNDTPL